MFKYQLINHHKNHNRNHEILNRSNTFTGISTIQIHVDARGKLPPYTNNTDFIRMETMQGPTERTSGNSNPLLKKSLGEIVGIEASFNRIYVLINAMGRRVKFRSVALAIASVQSVSGIYEVQPE